jgi:hypothetical protein
MSEKKFFNKDLPKKCEYCEKSTAISGGKEFFCLKKGIVEPHDSCRSYVYDPLKRTPAIKDIGRDYTADDFKL